MLRDKTERGEACFPISILWAFLGLGIDLNWVSAIVYFFLSFGINYGIITVIMKNERKHGKIAL
jgi:hypothetical protein